MKQAEKKADTWLQSTEVSDSMMAKGLNFEQFCHLMQRLLETEHLRVRIREGGLKQRVLTTGEPLNLTAAKEHPNFNHTHNAITGYTTRSVLLQPIMDRSKKEVIGVIELANKRGADNFSAEDARLVHLMSLHAAIFIDKLTDGEGIQGLDVTANHVAGNHFG